MSKRLGTNLIAFRKLVNIARALLFRYFFCGNVAHHCYTFCCSPDFCRFLFHYTRWAERFWSAHFYKFPRAPCWFNGPSLDCVRVSRECPVIWGHGPSLRKTAHFPPLCVSVGSHLKAIRDERWSGAEPAGFSTATKALCRFLWLVIGPCCGRAQKANSQRTGTQSNPTGVLGCAVKNVTHLLCPVVEYCVSEL